MKKIFAVLLLAAFFVMQVSFSTTAVQGNNFIPDKNSIFESGVHSWSTMSGGAVAVVNNPDGNGKVLKYYDIPSNKSYASCTLDIRESIQLNVSDATTIYGSLRIYTDNASNGIVRIRTRASNIFSLCTKEGGTYCTLTSFKTKAKEWTTVTFSFDITKNDLSSTEYWNLCFDSLASTAGTIYVDNVYIGTVAPSDDYFDEDKTDAEAINFIPENYSRFEDGTHNFSILSGGDLAVVDNPDGLGKVLEYYNIPNVSYASCRFDIRKYIQENVNKATTIYGSFKIYTGSDLGNTTLRIRTSTANGLSLCTIQGQPYCSIGLVSSVKEEWTTITFSFDITLSDLSSTEPWYLCFDGLSKYIDTIYIDDIYLGTTMHVINEIENTPIPEKTAVSRFNQTLVGTIRWDAFVESTHDGTDPASQVARVLSPKKYHGQAPYFSIVNDDGTIAFPEYTLERWEEETKYAVDAGLDYYAYCWYETTDPMSQPRKFHLESSKKDTIKMSAILSNIYSRRTMQELYSAMLDSCFLTIDGRPVIFLYGVGEWTAEEVMELRQGAANAGVEKALYIVAMTSSPNTQLLTKDIDAISWYGIGASTTGQTYSSLAQNCENTINTVASFCNTNNVDFIPAFTAGRDTRARIETGVSWVDGDPNATNNSEKPYANLYSLQPTASELQAHIENVLTYTSTSSAAKTNIVLSYAWNEHDEGGWLCPTLKVDRNNNVVKNADGTNAVNTERIDALSKAIENVFGPQLIYGDLNEDGAVNKKDELLIQMYIADLDVTINEQAADVYYDGFINKKDQLILKQYLANWDVTLGKK